jgi:hypothetical protein
MTSLRLELSIRTIAQLDAISTSMRTAARPVNPDNSVSTLYKWPHSVQPAPQLCLMESEGFFERLSEELEAT